MLSWQPNPQDPEAFHITHVNNLPSIRANGLVCDATVASGSVPATTIGATTIKQRRLRWQLNLPDRPCAGEFVPFNFCPRSVMLYSVWRGHASWRSGQGLVVHLVTRLSRLRAYGRRVVFTDSNAATTYAIASEDFTQIPTLVDWSVMTLTKWSGAPKEPRQAELLVATHVPWSAIDRVVVMDSAAQAAARAAVGPASGPPIDVDRSWYYP